MGWIIWLVVGIASGLVAGAFLPREAPGGVIGDLIAGIVGAVVFVYIADTVYLGHMSSYSPLWELILAGAGAVNVIGIAHLFGHPRLREEPLEGEWIA